MLTGGQESHETFLGPTARPRAVRALAGATCPSLYAHPGLPAGGAHCLFIPTSPAHFQPHNLKVSMFLNLHSYLWFWLRSHLAVLQDPS